MDICINLVKIMRWSLLSEDSQKAILAKAYREDIVVSTRPGLHERTMHVMTLNGPGISLTDVPIIHRHRLDQGYIDTVSIEIDSVDDIDIEGLQTLRQTGHALQGVLRLVLSGIKRKFPRRPLGVEEQAIIHSTVSRKSLVYRTWKAIARRFPLAHASYDEFASQVPKEVINGDEYKFSHGTICSNCSKSCSGPFAPSYDKASPGIVLTQDELGPLGRAMYQAIHSFSQNGAGTAEILVRQEIDGRIRFKAPFIEIRMPRRTCIEVLIHDQLFIIEAIEVRNVETYARQFADKTSDAHLYSVRMVDGNLYIFMWYDVCTSSWCQSGTSL